MLIILCSGSTIVGVGDSQPPQFIYDEDKYSDVFVSGSNSTVAISRLKYHFECHQITLHCTALFVHLLSSFPASELLLFAV